MVGEHLRGIGRGRPAEVEAVAGEHHRTGTVERVDRGAELLGHDARAGVGLGRDVDVAADRAPARRAEATRRGGPGRD